MTLTEFLCTRSIDMVLDLSFHGSKGYSITEECPNILGNFRFKKVLMLHIFG